MPAISLAVLVLITLTVVVFLVNPRETAEITVQNVSLFAPHTEIRPLQHAASKGPTKIESEDDLYVVATVRVTDKLRLPLFLTNAVVTLTTQEGSVIEATAVSPGYYTRLTRTFPKLAGLLGTPIYDGDMISPKETRNGTMLLLFPGANEATWNNRKGATLTLNLRNQGPQTVTIP